MSGNPTRDRIAERRSAVRAEILDAAWEVAREHGITQLTLRDVADRVGMRAPSLYTHFASKNDIYDAMFGQAWQQLLEVSERERRRLPRTPRGILRRSARVFFDFSVEDPDRFQLMNLRISADFRPSAEAYAPSLAVMSSFRDVLATIGITRQADIDLWVAVVGGMVESQLANDPGGQRWSRLLDRAVNMYADEVGIE